MRKLLLAYTTSLLMSPISGWALGMGDIRVNSHLNQPLNAEIELHSVNKKNIEFLRITHAANTVYRRADIARSDYLSKLKFKLTKRNGKNYISVTTTKPFKIPFANFLIEASWDSGHLIREYTVLLDPPEFIAKHARPVSISQLSSNSSQIKKSATFTQTRKNVISDPMSKKELDLVLVPEKNSAELASHMIKRNDTLWHIAKKMAPANVSVEQMMMALLRDNPDAFSNNNINNLKTGYVLRIKDRNNLNKISRSMANQQVKAQYESWKEAVKQKPVEHIVDRNIHQPENKVNDGKLSLISSGKTNKSGTNNDENSKAETLKEELSIASEDLNSKKLENQELKTRIRELEELIRTKVTLIKLKDKSLAILQKQQELKRMNKDALESDKDTEVTGLTTSKLADTTRVSPTTLLSDNKNISTSVISSGNPEE